MNLLQSFMGCMYPGSIRTESIESMDHDFPDCRFQVANIDERSNEVSRGEFQLTDRDLIYFRPGKFPTRWPIDYIRRYGYSDQDGVFLFEAGRRCPTGEAIYAFRSNRGQELVNKLKEKIEKSSKLDKANDFNDNNLVSAYRPAARNHANENQRHTNARHDEQGHRMPSLQPKRDAATSTDSRMLDEAPNALNSQDDTDPRPLSYALIDFNTTKALTESAQAHAANRAK